MKSCVNLVIVMAADVVLIAAMYISTLCWKGNFLKGGVAKVRY